MPKAAPVRRQPYMPDSARESVPHSRIQPLPPYLLEDFSQCLERARPYELIVPVVNGKPMDPTRLSCLQYRYLDTQETATVPNLWYNQTKAMRVSYWRWQADILSAHVAQAQSRLSHIEQHTGETYMGRNTSSALALAHADVEQRKARHVLMLQLLADVENDRKFA